MIEQSFILLDTDTHSVTDATGQILLTASLPQNEPALKFGRG